MWVTIPTLFWKEVFLILLSGCWEIMGITQVPSWAQDLIEEETV